MVEVLGALPRHPSGRVFPITDNAVQCAWEKVRAEAGLPAMHFCDLRHFGGTYWCQAVRQQPRRHIADVLVPQLGFQGVKELSKQISGPGEANNCTCRK